MQINCPYCGQRDVHEFVYLGDASVAHPIDAATGTDIAVSVYERTNSVGVMQEHWYHAAGCRRWLVATRNTQTHEILSVALAGENPL
jgi:methylglutamate dehydrogenase subunit B